MLFPYYILHASIQVSAYSLELNKETRKNKKIKSVAETCECFSEVECPYLGIAGV
jgi:hypothetical protein